MQNARALIRDGELLIVDGTRGVVIVNPDPRVEEYQLRKNQIELESSKLKRLKTARADARRRQVELHANIEGPGDVPGRSKRCRGHRPVPHRIPLPRSWRHARRGRAVRSLPQVVKGMGGRPVTIRTFDLGNDKDMPERGAGDRVKTNPALGLRAIRLSLAEPRCSRPSCAPSCAPRSTARSSC
jgi:phosphotransferase system enzyme I (PtsI)